jgi:Zn-dependent M28 family amino/carboxypeptidase
VKEPHVGADDNASGMAALLEAAMTLAHKKGRRRPIWFVAFSAEEMGVLGSGHFVKQPPPGLAIDSIVAMLNLDMVGRMRDNT